MADARMEQLLGSFSQLTHINVAAYDAQFRCIYTNIDGVGYCSAVHKSRECLARCVQSDTVALRQARKTGEPYLYTCPFGLCELIFPVRGEGGIVGYLIVGPTVQTSVTASDEALCHLAVAESSRLREETLMQAAAALAHYADTEMEALGRMVSLLREHIESNRLFLPDRQTPGQLVCVYVKKNLGEKITLSKMSKNLHCSTVTLTEAFRREFGMTIMEYVLSERMKLARKLLLTGASITEIAAACGYPDVEYFSKCFKRENGALSPTQWRKREREQHP
ncbi:MAG: PocR ligand-binding domain-containing protein [Clostridia bacterium]|nr:PocR ligand-binding domain-containing protein [Clostridia bacterium]MBO7341656.1 PocR ligand-binding domain-containing protein [Clostridia bacterium]